MAKTLQKINGFKKTVDNQTTLYKTLQETKKEVESGKKDIMVVYSFVVNEFVLCCLCGCILPISDFQHEHVHQLLCVTL